MNTLYRLLAGLAFIVCCLQGISRTDISGNLNNYAKVITVYPSADSIIVDNALGFSNGDTVMIIQMKGADFDLSRLNSIVNINNTGKYEFTIIQKVTGNKIKFYANLLNPYETNESVQLVRVPSYSGAKVVGGGLTCPAWNGYTGGILAIMVRDTLEMNTNIDVSGKGFAGGTRTTSTTYCYELKDSLHYQESAADRAGHKGGGIGKNIYNSRGRGAIGNAGGGGNGFGSGGGGGSGFGGGGKGSRESCVFCPLCDDTLGGFGGKIPKDYFAGNTAEMRDRIFMGGGGGSSLGQNNDATNGGTGGGIIFIITKYLNTNNYCIRSNGETLTSLANNEAGAGGGGGGGTILIALEKIIGPLNVEAFGGKGGNTSHCSGQGGGGGGGFVWFSGQSLAFHTLNFNGGACGITLNTGCPPNSLATNGSDGDSANLLNPVLNGFLFNVIGSDRTICYGVAPEDIIGTVPRGGNGAYTYQWQKRTGSSPWQTITDSVRKDYASPALYETTNFRRIVKSKKTESPYNDIIDTGKSVTIAVVPEIFNYSIAPDTSVCSGLSPVNIRGASSYGGNGTITYLWQESTNNNDWNDILAATGEDFPNPSTTVTRYYRRKTSTFNDFCTKVSNAVQITIYPPIENNNINQSQVICNAMVPVPFNGDSLSGGDHIYRYQWIASAEDSLHWVSSSPADTLASFSSGALSNTTFYRRIVFSGLRNTCMDTSNIIKITVLPKIVQNIIQQDQTICGGASPQTFTGSIPNGGDNTYRYQWLRGKGEIEWDSIATGEEFKNYKHGILDSTMFFRRIVRSGALDCCKDTSTSVKVTVQPAIRNNSIMSDQEICYGQMPEKLLQKDGVLSGGSGPFTFSWEQRSGDNANWSGISESGNDTSYQPPTLYKTIYYRRKAMSGVCVSFSDSITVTVLHLLSGNTLTGNHEVCDGLVPGILRGGNMEGGKQDSYRYVWQDSVPNDTWNELNGAIREDFNPYILSQTTYFRRIVKSGYNDCCVSKSLPFEISINTLPTTVFDNRDTVLCKGGLIQIGLVINAGTPPFEAQFTEGTYQVSIADLSLGLNDISFIPEKDGTYIINSVKDSKGCFAVSKEGSVKVRLVEKPKAYAGENAFVEGKTFQLKAIPSVGDGKWEADQPSAFQPDDTSSKATVTVEDYGKHQFTWKETNEFCWDTASVSIIFWKRYTGFSPNDDKVNDSFVVEGLDNFRKELIVVNRWGNEVYSSEDYKNDWEGTNRNGKPLPNDTYYYILKINNNCVYKGFIVIKR